MTPVGMQSIWTSSARLADGREIVYFDEEPGLGRADTPDTRPLPPRPPGPALPYGRPDWAIRWDRLAGEWVVIAAARQDRTFLPPADQCPLDPSAPGRAPRIPAGKYGGGGVAGGAPGPDLPAAGRPVPARPGGAGAAHRDTGGQLRRGGVREPLPLAGRTPRPLRGGLLHLRPRLLVRRAVPAPGQDRARGLGGPDAGARRAARDQAGVLL